MFRKAILVALFMLIAGVCRPQCTGALGQPIINETFGAGASQFGPPLPPGVTNMKYVSNQCPEDGFYAITNYTQGCFGEWHTITDHTGDKNGYFMLIDASFEPSDFYVQTVNGLCEGTTYKFAAWVLNMVDVKGLIDPNITFTIEKTDGTVLGTYKTGDIDAFSDVEWEQYGMYFTTPAGVSTVVLRMRNNAPGGSGNDIALDDITFSPSGPSAAVRIEGVTGDRLINKCYQNIHLLSSIGSCYTKTAYQWQLSVDGSTWADVAGAINADYYPNLSASGTYYYRLSVAENGAIGNVQCRTVSSPLTIIYTQFAPPAINNVTATVCPAEGYVLPSGKRVTTAGLYADTLHYKTGGCDSVVTNLNLMLYDRPNLGADRVLCLGDSTILSPGNFSHYLWQDNSTNPTLKIKQGGTYWVKVTDDNGCETVDTVVIKQYSCTLVKPPNTFTPNGDGVNDTWDIDGLAINPDCTVSVFSRWGQQVFKSTGYSKPWDGRYNGKPMPPGTYYYIINLNNNTPPVTGYVMLVR